MTARRFLSCVYFISLCIKLLSSPILSPSMMSKQKSALGSPSNSLQVTGGNLYGLCKDLDKFTRYFIIKAVQVIVQSRIGGEQKSRTECKPNGNDWFNINISDIVEISDTTKAVLNGEGLSVKLSWRVCCEISLKTNDGSKVVLEHWIISNKSHVNSSQKLNISGQASPGSNNDTRGSSTPSSSSKTSNGSSTMNTINISSSRVRTALFTSSSRNRLNSIGDNSSGDDNSVSTKLLVGATNENIDIKPSTSCLTLSSAQTANNDTQSGVGNSTAMASSPSTNSLNTTNTSTNSSNQNNHSPASNSNSPSQQKTQQPNSHSSTPNSKPSTNSSIYTIYNRMSLLLKTLLTTTHVVPAYRLASRASHSDTCVICYRVYSVPRPSLSSTEDVNSANASESPSKRSLSSTSSVGSIDIREFVRQDELDYFCPILKLGSVKSDVSEMDISVCYRTDILGSNFLPKSSGTHDMYNTTPDSDCLTAAKQLLAGNNYSQDKRFNYERHSSQNSLNDRCSFSSNRRALDFFDQPLRPAFAIYASDAVATDRQIDGISNDEQATRTGNELSNDCELIETAFEDLLKNKYSPDDDNLLDIASNALKGPLYSGNESNRRSSYHARSKKSVNAQSEPIQVPCNRRRNQTDQSNPESTPKSLIDSFVFVDLNPPFASNEQNDINSFFHGPSPSFSNGSSNFKDVDELTSQLANFEANASQIDDFVDNMCASEDEELEKELVASGEKGENSCRDEEHQLSPNMGHALEKE